MNMSLIRSNAFIMLLFLALPKFAMASNLGANDDTFRYASFAVDYSTERSMAYKLLPSKEKINSLSISGKIKKLNNDYLVRVISKDLNQNEKLILELFESIKVSGKVII